MYTSDGKPYGTSGAYHQTITSQLLLNDDTWMRQGRNQKTNQPKMDKDETTDATGNARRKQDEHTATTLTFWHVILMRPHDDSLRSLKQLQYCYCNELDHSNVSHRCTA